VIRHGFDLKVAGEEGVLLLAMQRVHAELLLQGDKARGEVLHVGPEPPPRDEEGDYTCDGPAQFLVDTCLGREAVDRASAELGIRTVAVMEAAWESAHTGLPVSIDALRHAARA
jgi:predicted dehydrogenase